ncbi:hypothetical protein [Actinacidiphila sp. bgisy145]|uniref:hypothetical protein n=1 Tax=Actinacidiphila sp. bgisy145 TaxID=3413792 RepID=UPI003EBD3932
MSAWCQLGQHSMPDREMTLLHWEAQPGGGCEIPVYGCTTHVREHGAVPRLGTGAAFVGRRDAAPIRPGQPT